MSPPDVVADVACQTGEGPLWHPDEELLYWTDIPPGRIYRYDPAADAHDLVYEDPDERIGGFTFQTDGSLLLFQEAGAVRRLDQTEGRVETVVEADPDRFHERFNDVIADPAGRVFAGVMPDFERGLPGEFYRLDRGGEFELLAECGLPNGMGFTPDESSMYVTDTGVAENPGPGRIDRYDYDRATGALSNRSTFFEAGDVEGSPDGMTVDAEGSVWAAFWDGHALRRFAPDGTHEETVRFDPRKVSSVTFGGPDYGDAYATTACVETRETEGEFAGSLFRADLGVAGRPEFRSDIEV